MPTISHTLVGEYVDHERFKLAGQLRAVMVLAASAPEDSADFAAAMIALSEASKRELRQDFKTAIETLVQIAKQTTKQEVSRRVVSLLAEQKMSNGEAIQSMAQVLANDVNNIAVGDGLVEIVRRLPTPQHWHYDLKDKFIEAADKAHVNPATIRNLCARVDQELWPQNKVLLAELRSELKL